MKKKSVFFGLFIIMMIGTVPAYANLISNGGFESGLTDWTCTTSSDGLCGTDNFAGPQEGSSHFFGYDNGSGGLNSQTFSTIVGNLYSISFYYGSSSPSPTNNLSVAVGDLSQSFTFAQGGEWNFFASTFSALASSTQLLYSFDTDGGSGTLWLDDIVVEGAAIPEPATMLLLGTGLVGVAGAARRKKKNQA